MFVLAQQRTSYNIFLSTEDHYPLIHHFNMILEFIISYLALTITSILATPRAGSIVFILSGSRGDIVPYTSLAKGIRKRTGGTFDMHFIAPTLHRELIERDGFTFRPLANTEQQQDEEMRIFSKYGATSARGQSFLQSPVIVKTIAANFRLVREHLHDLNPDVILVVPWLFLHGLIERERKVPVISINPFPWAFRDDFDAFLEFRGQLIKNLVGNGAIRMMNTVTKFAIESIMVPVVKTIAEEAGIDVTGLELKRPIFGGYRIYGYSTTLLPTLKPEPDMYITGGWSEVSADADSIPRHHPDYNRWVQLKTFIGYQDQDNRDIVFISFGSMQYSEECWQDTLHTIEFFLAEGHAVIFQGPNNGVIRTTPEPLERAESFANEADRKLERPTMDHTKVLNARMVDGQRLWLSPNLYRMEGSVPHHLFLGKMYLYMNHGGAGSVNSGARSRTPIIIKPFFGDQYLWCQQVQNLGIGHCLSGNSGNKDWLPELQKAYINIREHRTAMMQRMAGLWEVIKNEDSVGNFMSALHDIVIEWAGTNQCSSWLMQWRKDGLSDLLTQLRQKLSCSHEMTCRPELSLP